MASFSEEKYYKNKYHEAAKEAKKSGLPYGVYTYQMMAALKDMADRDIYPDGTFGDDECCAWSLFHSAKS